MNATISKKFSFDSAHRLPNLPEGHKCGRLHGHTYACVVEVTGEVDRETGFVMDYALIAEAWEPIHSQVDHYYLNEVPGLENPSSEILAEWVWERLRKTIPERFLLRVRIEESCTTAVEFPPRSFG